MTSTLPLARPSTAQAVFVGASLGRLAEAINARDLGAHCAVAASIDEVRAIAAEKMLTCAILDLSAAGDGERLKLILLAASGRVLRLVVIARAEQVAYYQATPGVSTVLSVPVETRDLLRAFSDALDAWRHTSDNHAAELADAVGADIVPELPPAEPAADEAQLADGVYAVSPDVAETVAAPLPSDRPDTARSDVAASLSWQIQSALHGVWRRFLPVANLLYKKLALVILTSLFLLFVSYGITILFFLTSSRWSLPIELSQGNELVLRAEKDLGELTVRQNQVQQALDAAESALALAERDKRDARMRLDIARQTIDLELTQQNKMLVETREHILRLRRIIGDFRAANGDGSFARNLEKAYENRTITKKSLEAGTLSILESLHRMAVVNNDLATAELDASKLDARIEFLRSLRIQIDQPEIRTLLTAGADLAYLARDVIADLNAVAAADNIIAAKTAEANHLRSSLAVVTGNIDTMLATPVGRAMTAPVTVVFVPYANAADYAANNTLYACSMLVFWCRDVGRIGEKVAGETTAVHPLFGKPLRGTFVEAVLDNQDAAQKEILHAVRPPLFF